MTQNTTTGLAIFVKTPHVSPLKTRLAATIGTPKSLDFYALSLKAVHASVQTAPLTPYWAVGEQPEVTNPLWQSFTPLHSGEGDLGDRQHHVYSTLRKTHKNVILIGADTPQITPDILTQTINALKTHNFVIGPATDGGYYLFASNQPLAKSFWNSIPWSADNTRSTLISQLPTKPYKLETLTDVDTEIDLKTAITQMPKIPTPAQKDLIDWAKTL